MPRVNQIALTFAFVEQYLREHGEGPKWAEMARLMGVSGHSVKAAMDVLRDGLYVDWDLGNPRSLRILRPYTGPEKRHGGKAKARTLCSVRGCMEKRMEEGQWCEGHDTAFRLRCTGSTTTGTSPVA